MDGAERPNNAVFNNAVLVGVLFRLTFRLFARLPAHNKAMRSIAWAGNLGEWGVGMALAMT